MDLSDALFYIHLASLSLAAVGVVMADVLAMKWLRGHHSTLEKKALERIHYIVAFALGGLIVTGLIMFWPMREYLLAQPLFLLKLFFVACLVGNSLVLGNLMHVATRERFATLEKKQRRLLILSGAVSGISWLGAGIVALILFGF